MIAAAPLTGWGGGESGRVYMNWFQDHDRTEGYATMVNSYLHVAVEHGLPTLALVLWIALSLLIAAWRGTGDPSISAARTALPMAAGASLVAWMGANVFTTLWIEPKLWIVPALAGVAVGWWARKSTRPRMLSSVSVGLILTVGLVGSLYGAGQWLRMGSGLAVAPGANGTVLVMPATTGADGPVWHAWPDPTVLGTTPGKELRRWLERGTKNKRLVVHRPAPLHTGEIMAGATGILLFGRQTERIEGNLEPECRELWLIHPSGPPPLSAKLSNGTPPVITVVLPQIDEVGNVPAWRQWAQLHHGRVIESPAGGLDIRAVWPSIIER